MYSSDADDWYTNGHFCAVLTVFDDWYTGAKPYSCRHCSGGNIDALTSIIDGDMRPGFESNGNAVPFFYIQRERRCFFLLLYSNC